MPLITTDLALALEALKQGKPLAIPTETVYGLAACIDNEAAIRQVFALKQRPLNHPLIVHVAKDWALENWVSAIPDYAQRLIEHYWPGPLTLVLKTRPGAINPLITAGQDSVAIRCPQHPLTELLLSRLGIPVVAPSANPFGKISPTTAEHVQQSFANEPLTILEGGRCPVGIESTIVDAREEGFYQILRQGQLSEDAIAQIAKVPQKDQNSELKVPGKLETHYQPEKILYYCQTQAELIDCIQSLKTPVWVLAFEKPTQLDAAHFAALPVDPKEAAYELYYQLRDGDLSEAETLITLLPPNTADWLGVRERILKAGQAWWK